MPKQIRQGLTAVGVAKEKRKGWYADGGNLYLKVTETGTKSWLFRYMLDGKARGMGLGPFPDVQLSEARDLAQEARRLLRSKQDPLDHRAQAEAARTSSSAKVITFEAAAAGCIAKRKSEWKDPRKGENWRSRLARYAFPVIGKMPVHSIETVHVMKILAPIWSGENHKNHTATRVRSYCHATWEWAKSSGACKGDNPFRWAGHLQNLLATPSKVAEVKHHEAIPVVDVPAFRALLASRSEDSSRALEFLMLTAVRTKEMRFATWREFDASCRTWTIPKLRTKMKKHPHRVPLSDAARALILTRRPADARPNDLVFPGNKPDKPMSDSTLSKFMRETLKLPAKPHGLRSSFRDWAAGDNRFTFEEAEKALGHKLGDDTVQSYLRMDMLERRRPMMQAWGQYAEGKTPLAGEVVEFKPRSA